MSEFDFKPKRKIKDSSIKSQRQLKVGEELRYLISNVLLKETFYDEYINNNNITITEVNISPDLKNAKIFIMPLGGKNQLEVVDSLNKEVVALKTNKIKNDLNLLYKIQIGTFLRSMLNNNQFTDLNVEEEKINGTFKYFVDAGNSKIEADRLKINLRNLGFKGAFIVAFLDGKQISTKEALNLQNKLKENE